MTMKKKYYIIVAIAILLIVLTYVACGGEKKSDLTYDMAEVVVSDITNSVTATGTIEPVTSVTVGTQVSGKVAHLYVDYNSEVKKGQVIAELDKTNLMSELSSAKANLHSAQSNLSYQKANYNRYQTLYSKGLISANDFEQARLSFEQAQQQVRTASENVNKAQTNLGYATITSPIDGVVLSKSVEEGQTVAASFNTPELFKIAQDLTNMQVIADIDEADIGEVKDGQRVKFTVDAYPEDVFTGTVTQVRQEATTESNVVTYQVVISAPNSNLKLKPGLTANVTIFTQEVKMVKSIPAKALKFEPNERMLTKKQSIQDCQSKDKVWMLEGDVFKAYPVTVGLSDGINTEIKSGLNKGQKVITEFRMNTPFGDGPGGASNNNPFMPKPPTKNKK